MPHTMSAVETRYCVVADPRLTPPCPAMMMGGVMIPASMANECWKPRIRARTTGMLSLSPKKGAARLVFLRNGRLGLKRKA